MRGQALQNRCYPEKRNNPRNKWRLLFGGLPGYVSVDRMAKTQSKVPVTEPHSTSSTYQSLARPAQRRMVSMLAVQMWQDLTVLIRPRANMLEKFTSQNWC